MTAEPTAEASPAAQPAGEDGTFDSRNPATGEVIASFVVHTPDDVAATLGQARQASQFWSGLGEPVRRARLAAWRRYLVAHTDELAGLIHAENGKPLDDAVLEVTIAISHLAWATSHARKVLGKTRVLPGVLAANHSATLEYLPFGVVGVIGPWNYPVHTPMGSISYALAAGNAVIFKPSEYTPAVAAWLVDSFAQVVPEEPVLQLLTGFAATGAALCTAGVDKLAFTGSATTGRLVMASCAQTLTPCVIECGGKDPMIVADDADIDVAAAQAVWGAMFNGGQTCAGVERVYVPASCYDAFIERVVEHAGAVRTNGTPAASYGPITMPGQLDTIRAHLQDALAGGARALVGGPESIHAPFVDPVILLDVPESSLAVTEETFGPIMVIAKVADVDEAIVRANSGRYGLGASVFSQHQGRRIAARLDAGMVSINSVLTFASIPGLPWGGTKDSGFGRIHGPDGLHEFARSRAVTQQRFSIPLVLTSFDRKENAIRQLKKIARLRWGR